MKIQDNTSLRVLYPWLFTGLYNTQRNNLFMRLDGCSGGVTHVQFSADGTKLFSGSRKVMLYCAGTAILLTWSFGLCLKSHHNYSHKYQSQKAIYLQAVTPSKF